MITINLLPKEFKRVEHKIALPNKVYIVKGVVVLLLLHIILFLSGVAKKVQVISLRNTWVQLEPDSKKYGAIKTEVKEMEAKVGSVKDFLSRKASFTELFSSLMAVLPNGIWLERFSFSDGSGLIIQGSVISLTQNEMSIISKFLQGLKSNKVFSSLFSRIELDSVQRRTIKTYDVVDFVLVGALKG